VFDTGDESEPPSANRCGPLDAIILPFSFRFLARDAEDVFHKYGHPHSMHFELLGTLYFLLALASNCAALLGLAAFAAITPLRVSPLLVFQSLVNRATIAADPGAMVDARLNAVEWAVILAFVGLLGFAISTQVSS